MKRKALSGVILGLSIGMVGGCAALYCKDCEETRLTIVRNEVQPLPPVVAVRNVKHPSEVAKISGVNEHVICLSDVCIQKSDLEYDAIWLHFAPDDFSGDVLGLKAAIEQKAVIDDDGYMVIESGLVGSKHFAFDSSKLLGSTAGLISAAKKGRDCKTCRISITGHTDSSGSAAYNTGLSLRRANAVKSWLVVNGVSPSQIVVKGKGKTMPIASNNTKAGRAKNRRAEYRVELKFEEN